MYFSDLPFWSWWILACALIVAELFTMNFVFLFFAVSAFCVGLAQFFGLQNGTLALVLFGALGLVLIILFRNILLARFRSPKTSWDQGADLKNTLILASALAAHAEAQAEYQGTTWTVVNDSNLRLEAGSTVVIHRTAGIKLIVGPTHSQKN